MSRFTILRSLGLSLFLSTTLGCEHWEDYRWSGGDPIVKPLTNQQIRELPPLAKNWAPAVDGDDIDWQEPSVQVYSFPTPNPSQPPLAIKDLSDRGQAALISALLKPGAKLDTLRAAVATPLSEEPGGIASVQESYSRTLVASVTKGVDALPGDRLMWTWILVKPRNFRFRGYSIVATDNQVLNIEHVQTDTTGSLQAQAGKQLALGQTVSSGSSTNTTTLTDTLGLTGSLSQQRTASADVNQQYMKLGADIWPHFLRIYRESERNLDVGGNTLVSLTVQADGWKSPAVEHVTARASKLKLTKSGTMSAPKAALFQLTIEKEPPHCALVADVRLLYQIRTIQSHRNTYLEGKQNVGIRQNATPWHAVTIVPANEVRPPSWEVVNDQGFPIEASDVYRHRLPLDFSSFEDARLFAEWVQANGSWLAAHPHLPIGKTGVLLSMEGHALTRAQMKSLVAARVQEEGPASPECQALSGESANYD